MWRSADEVAENGYEGFALGPVSKGRERRGGTGRQAMSSEILAQLAGALARARCGWSISARRSSPATPVIQLLPEFARRARSGSRRSRITIERGPGWYWNNISCGEHTGTHFDAPAHWVTGKDYADGFTDTSRCSASSRRPA